VVTGNDKSGAINDRGLATQVRLVGVIEPTKNSYKMENNEVLQSFSIVSYRNDEIPSFGSYRQNHFQLEMDS
jgi:hypothetical protein